jgi:hypothetical protein
MACEFASVRTGGLCQEDALSIFICAFSAGGAGLGFSLEDFLSWPVIAEAAGGTALSAVLCPDAAPSLSD